MRVLLLDAMNLIRRIYAAQEKRAANPVEQTEFLTQNAILKNVEETNATHLALVFDGRGQTWRHKIYADYKGDRKPMPSPLSEALPGFIQRYEALGIPCLHYDEYEADDIIATLAVKVSKSGGWVRIVSTDKGFMQISDHQIQIYHHFDKRILTVDDVQLQLGLKPYQLIDYLAMVGDTTNHVPGVPGIGPKQAGQLLDEYDDLDNVLIHCRELPSRAANALSEHFPQALLARKLVTLKTDCPLNINLQSLRYQPSTSK